MKATLRVLLSEVVDYAGVFPPARLDLDPAVRNYARYLADPDAWMLGKFVCPADALAQLARYGPELFARGAPARVAVLGGGGAAPGDLLDRARRDFEAVRRFHDHTAGALRAAAYEVRLPDDPGGAPGAATLRATLECLAEQIDSAGLTGLSAFLELASRSVAADPLRAVAAAVAEFNAARRGGRSGPVGLKLRCGGAGPGAIPTCEEVARVLVACRDAGVPLKFTAGLHHPLRAYDPGMQAHVHGFLNVLTAGVLAYALRLELPDVTAVLEEPDLRQFAFDEATLAWNEAEATLAEVRYARQHRLIAFGSCSFDEPREDLRRLRLLD